MSKETLVIRTPSGISGDMLVAGLARLARGDRPVTDIVASLHLGLDSESVAVERHSVGGIIGWQARIVLPHEHEHRNLTMIRNIILESDLSEGAKRLAGASFERLALAEADVHGIAASDVTFHEVGALDSIIDICVASALFAELDPAGLVCSPLPLCDGTVDCAHGMLATPAPAVQEMLKGIFVRGIETTGETVTPTAIAFLLSAGVTFGRWPSMQIRDVVRVYGGRILPGVPNGAIFASGSAAPEVDEALPAEVGHLHEHQSHTAS